MSWTPISKVYVYAQLVGDPRPLGVLLKDESGFRFAYAKSWLAAEHSFSIDPINLPLSDRETHSPKLWGCFDDAAPDNWGKKVMLAMHRQHPANQIEWLLAARGSGSGCLLFSASRNQLPITTSPPPFSALENLLMLADQIEAGQTVDKFDEDIAKLILHGSSMGGARPKVTVQHQGAEWIAKLSRREDIFNQPRAEFACLSLAQASGIDVPDHQLHEINGRAVLLVKRFDRLHPDNARQHYLSANALIAPQRMREGDPFGPAREALN